jgi:hypothetical protein
MTVRHGTEGVFAFKSRVLGTDEGPKATWGRNRAFAKGLWVTSQNW